MTDQPENPLIMNRRQALGRLAVLLGGAIVGAEFFLNGTRVAGKEPGLAFSAAELALMDEIGETIIPATGTPGARAVHIGAFMVMIVTDCYDDRHHAVFKDGLGRVEAVCQKQYGKSFLQSAAGERTVLLNQLDAEERSYRAQKPATAPAHFFLLMKQLTLLGYFTSEIGCTQALRYVEVPGAYHGNVPYKKGDRAWCSTVSHPS